MGVHERPSDQFEGPGKNDHRQVGADGAGAHVLAGEPGRDSDRQQAVRNPLGKIHQRTSEVAHARAVGEDQGGGHGDASCFDVTEA